MSVAELDGQVDGGPGLPLTPGRGPAPDVDQQPDAPGVARRRRLVQLTLAVVLVDWSSKELAWRMLPGQAVINADTSGVVPVLRGMVAQPLMGAIVDATALVLLVVTGAWLLRQASLPGVAWTGCALVWAGIGSNAADRWGGHLWLAPGSQRGVVDWIAVGGGAAVNLADIVIGLGLLVAIAALVVSWLPRGARAAVAIGVVLLVPVSVLTTTGVSGNAAPAFSLPSFEQRVRSMFWVSPKYDAGRYVWRDWRAAQGWNLTVEALDPDGLVLATWHLPSGSTVSKLHLPKRTSSVSVTLDGRGWVTILAEGLD